MISSAASRKIGIPAFAGMTNYVASRKFGDPG